MKMKLANGTTDTIAKAKPKESPRESGAFLCSLQIANVKKPYSAASIQRDTPEMQSRFDTISFRV